MKKRKAFTLVELLVVISILALLMSILLPSLSRAKESARSIVCSSNLKQIGLGATLWSEDHDGWAPGAWWWFPANTMASLGGRTSVVEATIVDYINATVKRHKNQDVLVCPSAKQNEFFTWSNVTDDISGDIERSQRLTYGANAGILHYAYNHRLQSVNPGPGTPASSPNGMWYGRNVEYVFDHGATKIQAIKMPARRVYFIDHAFIATDTSYFNPVCPPEELPAYLAYRQKVAARWHNKGCNAFGYGYGNITWVDGHVSKEPSDFDEIPTGDQIPRWEMYMWE